METTDISLEAIRTAVRKWVDEIEKMYPLVWSIRALLDIKNRHLLKPT